ncbi:MAG: proline/glycine betaine ABC transporter permease [Flaviflexus sp.]|nr:proline/glycine betaine ABC transporter permease [Flaviflexus sp.]
MSRSDLWFSIPIGEWTEVLVDWMTTHLRGLFNLISNGLQDLYELISWVLLTPPFWAVIIVLAVIAFFAKSWKLALATVLGFLLVYGMFRWDQAMQSLAQVIVASFFAIVIGVPLGILAARKASASSAIRPVLDFLQTMPAFVYLLPFILLFSVGVVPGIVSTILFSLPPAVRFTELGIRGVDKEVVEAGYAFGATPGRVLRQIQLPLAKPTIMAGINQVIMLSLSMVVISGLVGAEGLGRDIVSAISRIDVGKGTEAGLAVVILAIYLDRVTSSFGKARTAAGTA